MNPQDTSSIITAFLLRHIRMDQIRADEDIFAAGFVNSLFAMQLIAFIEKTFSVQIEDEDLNLDNFRSISAIEAFVRRKKGAA